MFFSSVCLFLLWSALLSFGILRLDRASLKKSMKTCSSRRVKAARSKTKRKLHLRGSPDWLTFTSAAPRRLLVVGSTLELFTRSLSWHNFFFHFITFELISSQLHFMVSRSCCVIASRGNCTNESRLSLIAWHLSLFKLSRQVGAAYQFGFDVKDDEFTNYQNRKESRDNGVIKGSYSVVDSDGFIRTVNYVADPKEGFKAEVVREPTDIVVKIPPPRPQDQEAKPYKQTPPQQYRQPQPQHQARPDYSQYQQ